jgi:hypothetical protein
LPLLSWHGEMLAGPNRVAQFQTEAVPHWDTQGRMKMRSSKFDPRRLPRSVTLSKKIVAGLLLVAAVIFLVSVISGIFR